MLKIETKNLGTAIVLDLQGQIVTGDTEMLRHSMDSLADVKTVILDLTQVTAVDAHGLGVMLELREQATRREMNFQLMNVSQSLSRVLEITKLDTVFQITSVVEFFPTVSRSPRVPMAALRSCA